MKTCTKCGIEKEENEFYKYKKSKDGLTSSCKECEKRRKQQYNLKNKDKHKEYNHKRYIENKELINISNKRWKTNNQDKHKEYINKYRNNPINKERSNNRKRERFKDDILFRLSCVIRCRTNGILKSKNLKRYKKINQYLGCTEEELKLYLESKFYPNHETGEQMTWENQGFYGWHIDHIIPLSSATTIEEIYKLSHYTNLQPLWMKENLQKSDKLSN